LFELATESLRTRAQAGDVIAHVDRQRGTRLQGQQGVAGGDAVGVGRGDGQAGAEVAQRPFADPADPILNRMQRGQEQVTLGAGRSTAEGDALIAPALRSPLPARLGGSRSSSTAAISSAEAGGPATLM